MTAWAQSKMSVSYVDENGVTQTSPDATLLDAIINAAPNNDKAIGYENLDNWFVVQGSNVMLNGQLGFKGNLNLILCDGAKLTINTTGKNALYSLDDPNNDDMGQFTIYGQESGTGQLIAMATDDNWANNSGIYTEKLTINGGIISTTGINWGIHAHNNIIINRGTVTAEATSGTAIEGQNVTINGGVVSATGSSGIKNGMTGTTTLGYTNSTDRITASNYQLGTTASLRVKDGQYMTTNNGIVIYGGLNDNMRNAIAGKTLSPYTPTEWSGSGTPQDPYIIASVEDLNLLSLRTVGDQLDYSDKYFKLMNNMAYDNTQSNNYTAIGTNEHPFQGHLDGNTKVISGIRVDGNNNYQGVFGVIDNGTITNLFVTDVQIRCIGS